MKKKLLLVISNMLIISLFFSLNVFAATEEKPAVENHFIIGYQGPLDLEVAEQFYKSINKIESFPEIKNNTGNYIVDVFENQGNTRVVTKQYFEKWVDLTNVVAQLFDLNAVSLFVCEVFWTSWGRYDKIDLPANYNNFALIKTKKSFFKKAEYIKFNNMTEGMLGLGYYLSKVTGQMDKDVDLKDIGGELNIYKDFPAIIKAIKSAPDVELLTINELAEIIEPDDKDYGLKINKRIDDYEAFAKEYFEMKSREIEEANKIANIQAIPIKRTTGNGNVITPKEINSISNDVFINKAQDLGLIAKNKVDLEKIKDKTIVLDAGHGGLDSGALAYFTDTDEKHINLSVAVMLQKILKSYGFNVIMTRESDVYLGGETSNVNKDLAARRDISNNNNADVFISIHVNSAIDKYTKEPKGKGAAVYVSPNHNRGNALAYTTMKEILSLTGFSQYREGVVSQSLGVLNKNKAACILVELGFITNKEESTKLVQFDTQLQYASAMTNAVLKHFKAV